MSGQGKVAPVLALLIDALEGQRNDDGRGAARALRALGVLAAVEVPGHGVFAAAERDDVFTAIEGIANAHLGFGGARRAFAAATRRVADAGVRDAIELSAHEMQSISDRTYFLAGIAFGVTLTRFGAAR